MFVRATVVHIDTSYEGWGEQRNIISEVNLSGRILSSACGEPRKRYMTPTVAFSETLRHLVVLTVLIGRFRCRWTLLWVALFSWVATPSPITCLHILLRTSLFVLSCSPDLPLSTTSPFSPLLYHFPICFCVVFVLEVYDVLQL